MNVIPAQAGIQCNADRLVSRSLDSCLRRNDDLLLLSGLTRFLRDHVATVDA